MSRLREDSRIDPRLKAFFGDWVAVTLDDVASRQELLRIESTPEAANQHRFLTGMLDSMDGEDVAPSSGITPEVLSIASSPDGNAIPILIDRPANGDALPCVCYIHGGAMQCLSCRNGNYRAWSRLIAAHGVVVAMIDFRNCLLPSSAPEVAPFPAGLNDCVSGLRYLHEHARALGIDGDRIVVAGESGGGNLAIASALKLNRDGDVGILSGIYALCPYVAGKWPLPQNPSSISNNLILMDTHHNRGRMAYGIEAFEARNALAWPGFATEADVRGLPPVVISVNECDPLRDEGVGFYRLLLKAGVSARCRESVGTTHAAELFPRVCPDLSREAAQAIAHFAIDSRVSEKS